MKIANLLAFLVVAGASLAIGYFVGSDMKGLPAAMTGGSETADAVAADPADTVVATIDGSEIRESDVKKLYETLPAQYRQAPYAMLKVQLVEQLVNMRIVQNAAVAEKYDTQEEFSQTLADLRLQALQEYYLQKKIEAAVTDAALQAEYEKATKDFKAAEEIRARHILLKEEQEAKDVITKLNDGGGFEALAKEFSTGPSGPQGGDLGYFTKDRMVPEFAEAAFALEKGKHTSEPVKTQFGWHVIKLEDRRDTQPPAFEAMKEQLSSTLTNTTVTDLIEKLKAAAVVSIVKPEGETPVDDKKAEESKKAD
ncbi:MAG: peptidylprolyl isomerase [Sneathiella sp.]